MRGRITGVNELTFDQQAQNMEDAIIHWYVAEAINTAWAVDAVDITLAAAVSSNTATITALDTTDRSKAFVLGSYRGSGSGDADANDENTIDVTLTNSTTVTAQRAIATAAGAIDWSGFVVEFASGGNENVYRNTLAWTTSEASKTNVTITGGPVSDTADCMVHVAGSPGTVGTGSFPGVDSDDTPDAFTAWTFTSTSALTVTHNTIGGEADQDISWEVIEWDVSAAPRRVMVIS